MPKEVKWAISLAVGLALLFVGWKFFFVLVALHVAICGLLIVVVLLQSGEAADLAGAFGGAGSQTAFGPRGAATFLSKATTWCAVMFMLTSMTLTMHQDTVSSPAGTSILQQFSTNPKPVAPVVPIAPAAPAAPAAPGPASSAPAVPAPSVPVVPAAPAPPAPASSK